MRLEPKVWEIKASLGSDTHTGTGRTGWSGIYSQATHRRDKVFYQRKNCISSECGSGNLWGSTRGRQAESDAGWRMLQELTACFRTNLRLEYPMQGSFVLCFLGEPENLQTLSPPIFFLFGVIIVQDTKRSNCGRCETEEEVWLFPILKLYAPCKQWLFLFSSYKTSKQSCGCNSMTLLLLACRGPWVQFPAPEK